MPISEKHLDDFIEIYKQVYKEKLSRDEALDLATRLLVAYNIVKKSSSQPSEASSTPHTVSDTPADPRAGLHSAPETRKPSSP